jgi:hypothetical protein
MLPLFSTLHKLQLDNLYTCTYNTTLFYSLRELPHPGHVDAYQGVWSSEMQCPLGKGVYSV